MKKISCLLGIHNKIPVRRYIDEVYTTYTKTNEKRYWKVHLLRCKDCNERFFECDDYISSIHDHPGVEKAKYLWLDQGICTTFKKEVSDQDNEKTINFNDNKKIADLLNKALSTTSESEAISCLTMARKYHFNQEK